MSLPARPSLNLVGAGRAGRGLAGLWQAAGQFELRDICTRSLASAQAAVAALGAGRAVPQLAEMRPADLWLLAVSDTQIEAVAKALSHLPLPAATAWHCSGFWPAAALGALQQRGWQTASAHPALSFAEAARASTPEPREQFAGTLCALEGDGEAVAWAEASFSAIGGRCFRLSAEDKPLYHAAAVLASNFQPVLQAAAVKLWQRCGLPEDQIGPLWRGFVKKGCDNLMRAEPAAVLTGPAARGDDAVVQAETEALRTVDPALAQAYEALSVLARRLALSTDQRADQSAD